jgi:hypothetical protein
MRSEERLQESSESVYSETAPADSGLSDTPLLWLDRYGTPYYDYRYSFYPFYGYYDPYRYYAGYPWYWYDEPEEYYEELYDDYSIAEYIDDARDARKDFLQDAADAIRDRIEDRRDRRRDRMERIKDWFSRLWRTRESGGSAGDVLNTMRSRRGERLQKAAGKASERFEKVFSRRSRPSRAFRERRPLRRFTPHRTPGRFDGPLSGSRGALPLRGPLMQRFR